MVPHSHRRLLPDSTEQPLDDVLSSLYRCAIVVFDTSCRIVNAWIPNDAATHYGIDRSRLLGRTLQEFLPPDQAETIENTMAQVMMTGKRVLFDTVATLPGGEFWYSVSMAPLRATEETVDGVVAFCLDVSEKKTAQERAHRQRQVLDTIFHTILDAAWLKDLDGRFVIVNRAYAALLGLTPEDIIGKTSDEFSPPEEAAKIRETDLQVIRTGRPLRIEQQTWKSVRPPRIFETVKTPVLDQLGRVTAIVGISRDITERKRHSCELERHRDELKQRVVESTAELVQQQAGLQAVFDAIPDLVVVIDERNVIISVHNGTETHACMPRDALEGHSIRDVLPAEVAQLFESAIAEAHATDSVVSRTYSYTGPHDTSYYRARFRTYLGNRTIVVVEDITARRRLEDRARRQQERVTHIQRINLVGGLATGIAHELNQPLGSIALYASMGKRTLRQGQPVDRKLLSELFEKIDTLALRCGKIIRNLRQFVRRKSMDVARVSVNELIHDALTLANPSLVQTGVRVETAVERELFAMVDEVQIQQVLLNLIANAVDAMSGRPPEERRLLLTAVRVGPWVELSIHDWGTGIDETDCDRVFDTFFTTKPDGIGVGLAICHSIIQRHGGSIRLRRSFTQGTVAQFRIPADTNPSPPSGQ